LLYAQVVDLTRANDPAALLESCSSRTLGQFMAQWHLHLRAIIPASTSARHRARTRAGAACGDKGEEIDLEAGDVVVLPPHRPPELMASEYLLVVGASRGPANMTSARHQR